MRSQAKRARLYLTSALAGGALLGTAGDAASWSNIVAPGWRGLSPPAAARRDAAPPRYVIGPGETLTSDTGPAIEQDDGGLLSIDNAGTISSTAPESRAIELSGDDRAIRVGLLNRAGGLIESEDDAFKLGFDPTGGTIRVSNYGTIRTTNGGQAIDFDDAVSGRATIIINNYTGGAIESYGADAIRPGQGAVVNNAGTIYSAGEPGNSDDGIDFQDSGGTVVNRAAGTISGARHAISAGGDLRVINYGTIAGRNGAGVDADLTGHVINYGTITGNYDGSGNGDGDGIDIDKTGYVENFGTIKALGAGGVHDDGRPNSADGVTLGEGGTVINHRGALIYSIGAAVPLAGTSTIVNDGTIIGSNGTYQEIGNDMLVNTGLIDGSVIGVQTNGGNDTVENSGTIRSDAIAIELDDGDDRLIVERGSQIVGTVDGGAGSDTLELRDGGTFDSASGFEVLTVSGAAALTGDNLFAATTIAAGATLTLGDGGTSGSTGGAILDQGALVVDRADAVRFDGTISGPGALVQAGTGMTTLANEGGYAGPVTIDAGVLAVESSLGSTVTVQGGALAFGGAIGGLTVRGGGTLGTGSGPGTLAVAGDARFDAGAIVRIGTTPDGGSDRLSAGGAATIGGGTVVLASGVAGLRPETVYTFLTAAGGVEGRFDAVVPQGDYLFVSPRLHYAADSVSVSLDRNGTPLAAAAVTANQAAVASALETAAPGAARGAVLLQNAAGAAQAFDALSGEIHASTGTFLIEGDRLLRDTLLAAARPDGGLGAWGRAIGSWGRFDARDGVAALKIDRKGFAAGIDGTFAGLSVGAAGGYLRGNADARARASSADIDTGFAALRARYAFGRLAVDAGGTIAWHHVSTRRGIDFPGFSEQAAAQYHARTAQGFVRASVKLVDLPVFDLAPIAGYDFIHLHTGTIDEIGGSAALSGAVHGRDVSLATLGLLARAHVPLAGVAGGLEPRLKLAWQHGWGDRTGRFAGLLADATAPFEVAGQRLARDQLLIDAAIGATLGRVRLSAGYLGSRASDYRENGGQVELAVRF